MNYSENMGISYNQLTQNRIKQAKSKMMLARKEWEDLAKRHQVEFETQSRPYFELLVKQKAELSILYREKKAQLSRIKKNLKLALFELKDEFKLNTAEIVQERKLTIRKIEVNYERALKPYLEQFKNKVPGAQQKLNQFKQEFNQYNQEFMTNLDQETEQKLTELKRVFQQNQLTLKEKCNADLSNIKLNLSKERIEEIKRDKQALIANAQTQIALLKKTQKENELKDRDEAIKLKSIFNESKKKSLKEIDVIKADAKQYYKGLTKAEKKVYDAEQKIIKQDQIIEFKNSLDRLERKIFKKINPAYIYITPAVFSAVFFTILPFIFMLIASMFKVNLTSLDRSTFQGFKNFVAIFTRDVEFQKSLSNTLIYALTTVGLLTVVTIGMAAWLSKNTKMNNAVQTMMFTPHIASLVAISILWIALLHPNGMINQILKVFGIDGPGWLIQEDTSLFSISLVAVWKDIGYYVLIIIAGLQAIPSYVYEAAKLDKASRVKTFFSITFPLLAPTLSFVFVNNFINSFKVFATIEIMTNGGPMGSSMVLSYWIYKVGRIGYNYGFAMAGAIILTVLIAGFTWLNWKFFNRKITY